MAIRFRCDHCERLLSIADRKAGAATRCPSCQAPITVPLDSRVARHSGTPANGAANVPSPDPPLAPKPAIPSLPLPRALGQPIRVQRRSYELLFGLAAVAIITLVYAWVARHGAPKPGGALGHGLGIVGFLLMLSTETLYSLRKRARGFHLWRTSTWLQIHIFTGFVGSWMVLLHSAGKLNGLAGVLMALTVVMVFSGFIGRYIYTAAPRNLNGAEVAVQNLEDQIAIADARLQELGVDLLGKEALWAVELPQRGWLLVFGRSILRWRQKRRLHQAMKHLDGRLEARAAQLEQLLEERYRLQMQVHSLAAARRLLALWHIIHVPLGVVLFTLAGIHIIGALYYSTFLK